MNADARRLWTVAEPFHALTYFAPESQRTFEEAGLRGFWRGYFAGRASPLGASSASLVTATFFGFHPEFVARAVPSIWSLLDPAGAIAARLEGIDRAARRIFGTELPTSDAIRVTAALRDAAEHSRVDGRPLFAANRELEWPEAPHQALWHAVTLLREHRGDGHVSALVSAGVDPCEAHTLRVADDELPLDSIQPYRGWGKQDWSDAATKLRAREWLDDDGRTTTKGRRARQELEQQTDRLSSALVDRIVDLHDVTNVLASITERLRGAGEIPYPNPVGVPPPVVRVRT
jgi:hypothetical protein